MKAARGLIYRAVTDGYDELREIPSEPHVQELTLTNPPLTPSLDRSWNRAAKHRPADVTNVDWTLYLDGSIVPKVPVAAVVESWLKKADIAIFEHPHRSCAYEEVDACVTRGKITAGEAKAAKTLLRHEGALKGAGLYALGIIARQVPWPRWLAHVHGEVLRLMESSGVWRDQLFMPIALRKFGQMDRVHVVKADVFMNPWFSYRRHG